MFHETLFKAVETGLTYATDKKAEINADTIRERFSGGMVYGETKEAHAEIVSLKGKPTKKWFHLTIWRDMSGRYEVNTYIL